jgi:hypothetical protein
MIKIKTPNDRAELNRTRPGGNRAGSTEMLLDEALARTRQSGAE